MGIKGEASGRNPSLFQIKARKCCTWLHLVAVTRLSELHLSSVRLREDLAEQGVVTLNLQSGQRQRGIVGLQ